jgi:hypothetical protein
MVLFCCYLRKGLVYIPTIGQVEGGPYRQIEPIVVVAVTHTADLLQGFQEAIARGNPRVSNVARGDHEKPAVLKYAGVGTYAAFARIAQYWMIEEQHGVYRIVRQKRIAPRGWVDDPENIVVFLPNTGIETVIEKMITILQQIASE